MTDIDKKKRMLLKEFLDVRQSLDKLAEHTAQAGYYQIAIDFITDGYSAITRAMIAIGLNPASTPS